LVVLALTVERFNWLLCPLGWNRAVPLAEELPWTKIRPGRFRNGVAALVTTLRYAHAISYARLSELMSQLFNLSISEGALANLFERVKTQLEPTIEAIVQRLRSSRLVGSDETSARLKGKTVWEWVFQNAQVCLHVIRPSRGADVIGEVMGSHQPEIWVSDLFSAQKKHPAEDWQVCLENPNKRLIH
jgi:transposase